MKVLTYTTADAFLNCVQPLLEEREAENNLILGLVLRLQEHPDWIDTPPYLAAIIDESDNPLLVAIMTPPRNLLLSARPALPGHKLVPAVEILAQTLFTGAWPVPGVNAETTLAELFALAMKRATGKQTRINMRTRIYELRRVIPPPNPPPGKLRQASSADMDVAVQWYLAFSKEAMGKDSSLEEAQKQMGRFIESGNIFFWNDNNPVSMAARSRPTPHGYTVTGVYTPPKLRGKGYASACVAALSQQLLDGGKQFCTLFTDLSNPTSNSIYQKVGYRPVCDFTEFLFEE